MNKILVGTLGIAALASVAVLVPAEPVAAKDYAFCRQDDSSGMRSCGFETMEQCVIAISGRGGTCTRDPYVTETGEAYAYVPKGHGRRHRSHVGESRQNAGSGAKSRQHLSALMRSSIRG